MNTFKTLILAEIQAELLKAMRQPQFVAPTLAFPLVFYSVFGVMMAPPNSPASIYLLASFGVFAAMGPSIFGVGFGVSTEKQQGWLDLKRVAPVPASVLILSKLFMALVFTAVVLFFLYLLAAYGAGVILPRNAWMLLAVLHLASSIPFCLLGLAIGLRFSSQVAAGVMNLCFFALAILGGLWMPLSLFPAIFTDLALAMPSFHFASLARSIVGQSSGYSNDLHLIALVVASLVFAALASAAWRRAQQD